jgi:methylated-DNA-protein-cysteine methyltransferase-like protein
MAALPGDTDVPWWRVIRSTGALALQGDPSRGMIQRARLEEEAVRFRGDRVDLATHGWAP